RALHRRLLSTKERDELDRHVHEMATLVASLAHPRRDDDDEAGSLTASQKPLQTLFGRLRVPAGLGEELDALRQRLDRARSQAMLIECAEAAAAMLSTALASA